jgi:hypothetical protein
MKTTNLMRCALGAAVLAAFGLVGCESLEPYSIDAPSDLQRRIDSIAASKPNTGDTTYIIIATPIVGPEDNSAGWWAYFSDYFTIPANKLLHLEFVNHGTGINNWNNWNLPSPMQSVMLKAMRNTFFSVLMLTAGVMLITTGT